MSDSTAIVKHAGGRPSKAEQLLTPEMLQEIGLLLSEGHFKETVSDFLGVDRKTWWSWEQRGELEPNSIYGEFLHIIKKSIAVAEILLIRQIRMGGEQWQRLAWLSERRFPGRWGRRVEVTVRREAERLAEQLGVDANEIIAEAERLAEAARR